MKTLTAAAVVAALSVGATLSVADHDRPPTAEERARIVQALESLGYKSHGEIEVEGSRIEVEDVLDAQGNRYEIELDAKTYQVIRKEREHD